MTRVPSGPSGPTTSSPCSNCTRELHRVLPRPDGRASPPAMDFPPPTCDSPRRIPRVASPERGLIRAHSGALAGRYPARCWPVEQHGQTAVARLAGSHHDTSRPPRTSPPRTVTGAMWHHPVPSSGHAYDCPSDGTSLAPPECGSDHERMIRNDAGGAPSPTTGCGMYRHGFCPRLQHRAGRGTHGSQRSRRKSCRRHR